MQDVSINCPHCMQEIRLDETLAGPLVARTRQSFEAQISTLNAAIATREAEAGREMRATQRLWARREQQIGAVVGATSGLYGDLQGIAGSAVAEIPGLALPLLASDDPE